MKDIVNITQFYISYSKPSKSPSSTHCPPLTTNSPATHHKGFSQNAAVRGRGGRGGRPMRGHILGRNLHRRRLGLGGLLINEGHRLRRLRGGSRDLSRLGELHASTGTPDHKRPRTSPGRTACSRLCPQPMAFDFIENAEECLLGRRGRPHRLVSDA